MSTDIIPAVQEQSIDDSLVDLFEFNMEGLTEPVYFTSGLDANDKNLYFPTEDGTQLIEYVAIPINMGNIELSSDGPQNRPVLTVANLVSLGRVISNTGNGTADEETFKDVLEAQGITKAEDLVGTTLIYRRTLLKNTYRQTDVAGWTTTLPKEFPKSKYIIDRVSGETGTIVNYELTSPFDVEGVKIPGRIIIGKYCPWEYQGIAIKGDVSSGCTWPCKEASQNLFYDIEDNVIDTNSGTNSSWKGAYSDVNSYIVGDLVTTTDAVTSRFRIWICINAKPANASGDPRTNARYWERHDICGKTLSACKVRFQGPNEVRQIPLPFGGFPGTKKFR